MTAPTSAGTLYVVATPIGNLEDLTFRALRILREVTLIAAEDTRRTAKLLTHYEIHTRTVSLREHNEARETARLIERLTRGEHIALVSDAGTPAIADPGARLVRAAHEHGIRVVPIPGPSAVTAALSAAGLTSPEFVFMGFPPATGSVRRVWFERLTQDPRAVVFFEAPHRIQRTLDELANYLVNRQIIVFRELTKINEILVFRYNNDDLRLLPKGEFVIVVDEAHRPKQDDRISQRAKAGELIGRLTNNEALSDAEISEVTSVLAGVSVRSAAKLVRKHKISVKRQNEPPA